MAQLVLSTIGAALGAKVGSGAVRAIATQLGRAAGSALGSRIDDALFAEPRRVSGGRLTDLYLSGSSEGASLPKIYGRARVSGEVIWAARFKEKKTTTQTRTGGKNGTRVESTQYQYSLSFAVALCEGEIAGIGQVWANGALMDLSTVAYRLHRGTQDQLPDSLIEAIEGADAAPAYRHVAYLVFEDLPLADFGNSVPTISAEVIAPAGTADRLENRARGVCLIPGAGEFVYATSIVRRSDGAGGYIPDNAHATAEKSNFTVSLDQLQAELPEVRSVLLVVSWFGDDLRCGVCQIRPGVETATKETTPWAWRVGPTDRAGARLLSRVDGGPAFGGTPDDRTIVEAIKALKARGYKVGLYPFVLMDIPQASGKPNPYGPGDQAAYPWRGRITGSIAPGLTGTPDKTSAAVGQVGAFFGSASASHFSLNGDGVSVGYAGPNEWSFRRFILHYAKLAQLAGGVDSFVLGSELVGLTTLRSGQGQFPAVDALKTLAGDVRGVLGASPVLTYGADWTEYAGYRPQDGSHDVYFHLDPLWADPAISTVGVDWYPPLSDWRDGTHTDQALATSPHDVAYLEGRIEGGEAFDWYYASDQNRKDQVRTPITDGAYGKSWVFRAKDLRSFWSQAHRNRPGGVEASTPTAWVPQSKPFWFVELGCPAVDKGSNGPNLFLDNKSSESALPAFSNGTRDDLIQRRVLEAYLAHWAADSAANPISAVDGRRMIDADGLHLWCWDARPYPVFPSRGDVWADVEAWTRGHWLSGRVGAADVATVIADLCARAGLEVQALTATGLIAGLVVEGASAPRSVLEQLMQLFGLCARVRDGVLHFEPIRGDALSLLPAQEVAGSRVVAQRLASDEVPSSLRLRSIDPALSYRVGQVTAHALRPGTGGEAGLDVPFVLTRDQAQSFAHHALARLMTGQTGAEIGLAPGDLALEPGDLVALSGGMPGAGAYRVQRVREGAVRALTLAPHVPWLGPVETGSSVASAAQNVSTPAFCVLDPPCLSEGVEDTRPLVAVATSDWRGDLPFYVGSDAETATLRAVAGAPAAFGVLEWALWPGPVGRWDRAASVRVRLPRAGLSSVTERALLDGANAFAVQAADGVWEVFQAREAVLVAPDTYDLRTLLRAPVGRWPGSEPIPVGAALVLLDERLVRLDFKAHEANAAVTVFAAASGRLPSHPATASRSFVWEQRALMPPAPVHLRAKATGTGDTRISWVRCARYGGDDWGAEPPQEAEGERYTVDILRAGVVVRSVATTEPLYAYPDSLRAVDLAGGGALTVRVRQLGLGGRLGWARESAL